MLEVKWEGAVKGEAECGCGVRTGWDRTEKGMASWAGVGVRDGWSSEARE